MAFNANFSSSPPSTPDKKSGNGQNIFSFGASNPSTTPAGPPPSSTGSYTPAGQPPSSFFGSSIMENGSPLKPLSFSQKSPFGSPSSPSAGFQRSSIVPQRSGLINEYRPSPPRGFQAPIDESDEEEEDSPDYIEGEGQRYTNDQAYISEDGNGMMDDEAQYDDEAMDEDQSGSVGPSNGRGYDQRSSSDLVLSPGGLRRSRESNPLAFNDSLSQSHSQRKASLFGPIAKGLYTRMTVPELEEPDELILETERIITRLYAQGIGASESNDTLQEALVTIPKELVNVWEDYNLETLISHSEEYTVVIGPGPKASNFQKANYVAGLALQIHHPHTSSSREPRTVPQVMLEWLDEHHNAASSYLEDVQTHKPSPSNSRLFWDAIFSNLVRGKVGAVANLLRNAGWKHSRTNSEDQYGELGFSSSALKTVEEVARRVIDVLNQCPANRGDWDIRGSDWTLFRLRISHELESLKSLAGGRNKDEPDARGHEASSFASRSNTYSRTAQKAQSKVPWHIYQNIVTLYSVAMGDCNAIIEVCGDWIEATAGLLVWWDEGKDDRRLAFNRSRNAYRASSRRSDMEQYLRKLRRSFETATAESTEFNVNTADEVEVSLASLFEGDIEALVGFLRGWSGPVSAAFAEVASFGGWLPQAEPQSLINMGSLDQDDLDVLGLSASPVRADGVKDLTLITYAESLADRESVGSTAGWELSIAILGRLDSTSRSEERVENLLQRKFRNASTKDVEKLWRLLNDVGMDHHAENVADSYATRLAEGSHRYGEALWYYALAHKTQKVKDVLDLLISISLTYSTAYPPEPALDDYLRRLVGSPSEALTELSHLDLEAADLLQKMLSGYATLRKFYSLRDGTAVPKARRSKNDSITRKTEAAAALISVISSSDDNIRGGLYDEERGAVVNVDFLLALLGEAMVFVNQPGYTITLSQIHILLKAIEDLQTVGPRVYFACAEFLKLVIESGSGLKGSSPTDMLRKTMSNSSGSSSFSMVGSSILALQLKSSIGGSGVLEKENIHRAWDWRLGISASTTGDDVLRVLRHGLAKDLARAWLYEADNKM